MLGYLVGVLSSADTTGEVFDIGGREILSYRGIMRIMAEELDLPRRWILPVPLFTPRLSLTLDSARHAVEPSHRASAGRGSQERSSLP